MKKEVLCIRDNWVVIDGEKSTSALELILKKILPKLHETYFPIDMQLQDTAHRKKMCYSFSEFNLNDDINWFDCEFFVDITSLSEEIVAALKAKTPKKRTFTFTVKHETPPITYFKIK